MCVSSRTAQAEEPSEQGEGGDDEDQAWFVCPFRVCSEVASKAARRDVEEQAASAQTTDLVEDAPKASERAVGLRFCSLKSHCILWPLPLLVQGEQLQKTALEKNQAPAKTANRCVRQTRRQSTAKHPCTRQDPAQAQRVLLDVPSEAAANGSKATAAVQNRWQKEFNGQNDQEAKARCGNSQAEANQQVDKVMQKLEAARASVQAGPGQAGASACAVVAVAFDLHSRMVVVRFRAVHRVLLFGVMLSSRQGSRRRQAVSTAFTGSFSEGGALGCFRFHKKMWLHLFYRVEKALWLRQRCYANLICTSCFADASERGVSPRLEVGGGSACFPLALTGCWCWQ